MQYNYPPWPTCNHPATRFDRTESPSSLPSSSSSTPNQLSTGRRHRGKLSKVAYTGVSTDKGAHILGVISSTRKTTIRDFEEDRHSIIASAEAVIISGSTGLPSVNSLHTSWCTPLSQKEIFSHTPLSQIATERYSRMPTDFIQPIPLSLSLKYFWVEFMQTWYFHIFFPALFRDPMKAFYCTGFPFFRSRLSLIFQPLAFIVTPLIFSNGIQYSRTIWLFLSSSTSTLEDYVHYPYLLMDKSRILFFL